MPFTLARRSGTVTGVAVVAAALIAAPTLAGPIAPDVTVAWTVSEADGTSPTNGSLSTGDFGMTVTNVGGTNFNYVGADNSFSPEWGLSWDFNGNGVPTSTTPASIGSVFTITNDTETRDEQNNIIVPGRVLRYSILVTMALNNNIGGDALYAGSGGFTLTGLGDDPNDPDPFVRNAALVTVPGSSLWSAQINGSEVANLWPDLFGIAATGGSISISDGLTPGVSPGGAQTLGVKLEFLLTPGDSVTTSGIFAAIPAPSALALLGVGGLLGGRRRRR
jgi:hypothetical protein